MSEEDDEEPLIPAQIESIHRHGFLLENMRLR